MEIRISNEKNYKKEKTKKDRKEKQSWASFHKIFPLK